MLNGNHQIAESPDETMCLGCRRVSLVDFSRKSHGTKGPIVVVTEIEFTAIEGAPQ